MLVTEVSPYVRRGSFWAWLHPLALARAKLDSDSEDSACFEAWTPFGMKEALALMPVKYDVARLLWYNQVWPLPHRSVSYTVGDVVIVENHRLWFVGPDTNEYQIQTLADWKVDERSILAGDVYQSGHTPEVMTRFKRLPK